MKTVSIAHRISYHSERAAVYRALYKRLPVSCTMRRAHAMYKMQEHLKCLNLLKSPINAD
jgi:hypothetical protein